MESGDLKEILKIENILASLEEELKIAGWCIKYQLSIFLERFEKEFPSDVDSYRRGGVEGLTWAIMTDVLFLYALGRNDSVIIHLHGILEQFAVRELKKYLNTPKTSPSLSDQIDRQGLFRSAKILCDFEVIDDENLKFLKELNILRNAVVHKDVKRLSKLLGSKESRIWLDTLEVVSGVDTISLILNSLKTLHQMGIHSIKQIKD